MKFGGDIKFKKDTLKEVMIDVNKKKKKDFRRIQSAQKAKKLKE
jgi:hypothetical protein